MREMHGILKDYITKFTGDHRKKRRAFSGFLVLAVIVSCSVIWSLKLDGITLAGDAFCGKKEHTHNEKCMEKVLICKKEEHVPTEQETELLLTCAQPEHAHSESCTEQVLVCGQEESAGHRHSSENGCYELRETLVCTKGEHAHSANCYVEEHVLTCEDPDHEHTEDCYTTQRTMVCTQEEHAHGEDCYQTEQVLICALPESDGHAHSESCYETRYICGQPEHTHISECYTAQELPQEPDASESGHKHTDKCYETHLVCKKEEHVHTPDCYSDKKADLESPSVWEKTLPGSLTGIWSDDLISIARSQLGYQESVRNYILDEDGERRRGYTRYGAWYGNPYGDWCAMFASFCLNYAKIPQSAVPYASGCYAWSVDLQNRGMFRTPSEYVPSPGDLIFFRIRENVSDHVGIVTSVDTKRNIVRTIEGNSGNCVQEKEYALNNKTIFGYGVLPENPDYEEPEEITEQVTEDAAEESSAGGIEGITEEEPETLTGAEEESDSEANTSETPESEEMPGETLEETTEAMTEDMTEEVMEEVGRRKRRLRMRG